MSPPIWFPTGFRLLAAQDQEKLSEVLLPWMRPPHYLPAGCGTCPHRQGNTKVPREGAREKEEDFDHFDLWPPSSPDINPLDFSVWWEVEKVACAILHSNLDSLKHSVSEQWLGLYGAYIKKVCVAFPQLPGGCCEGQRWPN